MSISIIYAPLLLISWAIMDKKKFEEWSKSSEIREKLNIEDMKTLKDIITASGVKIEDYGFFLKTEIGDQFFFWEKEEDGIYLTYTNLTDFNVLKEMKEKIESNYEKSIFETTPPKPKAEKNKLLPTNFFDLDLLLKVLNDYAVDITFCDGDNIKCDYQGFHFEFVKTKNGIYYVKFDDADKLALLHDKLVLFDNAYNQNLQNMSYQKIKQKLEKQNKEIVKEYVDENDDIVIVINA